MLATTELNIFWNTYVQECAFRDEKPFQPRNTQVTCRNLGKRYRDPKDMEMFIRSQFLMKVDGDYSLNRVVFTFVNLNSDRHFKVYEEYLKEHDGIVCNMLDRAYEIRKSYLRGAYYPWQKGIMPLGIYVAKLGAADPVIQKKVAVECLHWPGLMRKIPLTDFVKGQIQRYKAQLTKESVFKEEL